MKAFLDTNILLDILMSSRPSHIASLQVLQLIRSGVIRGALTTQSIIDASYVCTQRQKVPIQEFKDAMNKIFQYFDVIPISSDDIRRVNNSSLPDYEDATQVSCALDNCCDVIISNDTGIRDYTGLEILSASEFLDKCLERP